MTTSTTFTNLAEQISRIEPPYPHDWLPYSSSEDMLSTSVPVGHHMFSASEDDDEDEFDETMVMMRMRPRTGSLSEHEDILALKAQAQAVIRREEAGYDVSLLSPLD